MNATQSASLVSAPSLVRAGDLTERSIDGELVIYDSRRQRVHALNATAAFIWYALEEGRGLKEVVALLSEHYPDCRQAIEADVAEAVDTLLAEGLLLA